MKRFFTILICVIMVLLVFGITACADNETTTNPISSTKPVSITTTTTTMTTTAPKIEYRYIYYVPTLPKTDSTIEPFQIYSASIKKGTNGLYTLSINCLYTNNERNTSRSFLEWSEGVTVSVRQEGYSHDSEVGRPNNGVLTAKKTYGTSQDMTYTAEIYNEKNPISVTFSFGNGKSYSKTFNPIANVNIEDTTTTTTTTTTTAPTTTLPSKPKKDDATTVTGPTAVLDEDKAVSTTTTPSQINYYINYNQSKTAEVEDSIPNTGSTSIAGAICALLASTGAVITFRKRK